MIRRSNMRLSLSAKVVGIPIALAVQSWGDRFWCAIELVFVGFDVGVAFSFKFCFDFLDCF